MDVIIRLCFTKNNFILFLFLMLGISTPVYLAVNTLQEEKDRLSFALLAKVAGAVTIFAAPAAFLADIKKIGNKEDSES